MTLTFTGRTIFPVSGYIATYVMDDLPTGQSFQKDKRITIYNDASTCALLLRQMMMKIYAATRTTAAFRRRE
ncbi:MAG: hypothetical protein M3298_05135 [Thermoproteota archaeon]|nr:hypothetical protein [Thermoproteota archaeon]